MAALSRGSGRRTEWYPTPMTSYSGRFPRRSAVTDASFPHPLARGQHNVPQLGRPDSCCSPTRRDGRVVGQFESMGSANGKIGFIFPACYLYSMSVQRILSVAIILVLLDTFLSRQSFAPPVYVEPFLYVLALYFVLVLLGPLLRRLVRKLNPPAVRGGSTVLVSAVNSGVGAMVSRGFLRSISVGAVRQSDTGPSSDALALGPPHELGPCSPSLKPDPSRRELPPSCSPIWSSPEPLRSRIL